MVKALAVEADLCTGCELCSQICAWVKFKDMNPRRGAAFVIRDEPTGLDSPVFCTQCGICVEVCPIPGALKRVKQGWIEVDVAKCDGCGLCEAYCPLGVIRVDSVTNKAFKCDLCKGNPACAPYCPQGVIKWVDAKQAAHWRNREYERAKTRHGSELWWSRYKLWMRPWYKEK